MPEIGQAFFDEAEVASAATCDIGATDEIFVEVTGSTGPITSFGAMTGKLRFVRFTGTPTLTHNAVILLPGAANITVAANARAIIWGDETGVCTVLFQRANGKAVIGPASTDITDSTAAGRALLTAADASAQRTAIGLPLGTSGATVPLNNTANVFSAAFRATATAAFGSAALVGGVVQVSGDLATNPVTGTYAQLEIVGVTNSAKRLSLGFDTTNNVGHIQALENAVAFRTLNLQRGGAGVIVGNPTGGDKGAGTLNAVGVYDDNVLLTDYVFDKFLGGQRWQYSARVQAKYDDLNAEMFEPDAFELYWREHRRLYGMPDLNDCLDDAVKLSLGEQIQRLTQTVELMAVHMAKLNARLKASEAKR